MNQESFIQGLSRTVRRIQLAAHSSDNEFREIIGITDSEFRAKCVGSRSFDLKDLQKVCDHFDLSLDRVLDAEIDYLALEQRVHGNKSAVPEKYSDPERKLARGRTALSIIEYLNDKFGYEITNAVTRRLQVSVGAFSDPDSFVNPYLISDLLSEMSILGIEREHLLEVGKSACKINSATRVGKLLSGASTPMALYSIWHEELMDDHYDRLFNYRIERLSCRGLTMVATPRWDALDRLGGEVFGNREVCLYRQGVYRGFIMHIREEPARLLETSCTYLGDSCCTYVLSW